MSIVLKVLTPENSTTVDVVNEINENPKTISVFLAGTIDMGESENWQSIFVDKVTKLIFGLGYDLKIDKIVFLNPRRSDWDSSWGQNPYTDVEFIKQVEWELKCLEVCNIMAMNLLPGSKSPISLLELGLFKDKALVCCQKEFYRFGNVAITCDRYSVPLYQCEDSFYSAVAKACLFEVNKPKLGNWREKNVNDIPPPPPPPINPTMFR